MSRSNIDDFITLNRLGSGSFGTVYKVERKIDHKIYVIKSVRISELSYGEQTEAINEVKILAQLDSPYVVTYYDSFMDAESLKIVMEYCNKGDLQSLLKKAKSKKVKCLKEYVTWDLCLQIILGLEYLHSKKILHRDLKSANVFLKKENGEQVFNVKIGDLGVAKLLETSTAFASTIVGTPYYLSPELCADKPYRDKSDCWALGVLIYECCTLKRPFEARNQCALIMKIMQAKPESLSKQTVSPELNRLVVWLLQKDPTKRPTIREILNDSLIRRKLKEHQLESPSFLDDYEETHYLNKATSENEIYNNTSTPNSKRDKTSTSLSNRTGAANSYTATPQSGQNPNSAIKGNRVRGGVHAQRITSSRAMSRHQKPTVQTPSISSSVENINQQLTAESKDDYPLDKNVDVINISQKMTNTTISPTSPSDIKQVEVEISTEAKIVNNKMNSIDIIGSKNIPDNDKKHSSNEDDFDEYEDDFEPEGEMEIEAKDSDLSKFYPGDAKEIPDNHNDINNRNGEDDVNESLRHSECGETEIDGSDQTQLGALRDLIEESRQRSLNALGESLFHKVYKLCANHMMKSSSNSDVTNSNDIDGKEVEGNESSENEESTSESQQVSESFLQELELALAAQMKDGVDIACDAVFGVKVLLALEERARLFSTDSER